MVSMADLFSQNIFLFSLKIYFQSDAYAYFIIFVCPKIIAKLGDRGICIDEKVSAQKLIFLILMMMRSPMSLLTDTYPVMNKTLALFGIALTVTKAKNTRKD